jgi:hypothetical protein
MTPRPPNPDVRAIESNRPKVLLADSTGSVLVAGEANASEIIEGRAALAECQCCSPVEFVDARQREPNAEPIAESVIAQVPRRGGLMDFQESLEVSTTALCLVPDDAKGQRWVTTDGLRAGRLAGPAHTAMITTLRKNGWPSL